MRHPTLEEFTQERTHTEWRGEHRGVGYKVTFWGYREHGGLYDRPGKRGMWNYYLLLPEPQWRPEDWERFVAPRNDFEVRPGHRHRSWDISKSHLYGLDWHGGMTFYEILETPRLHQAIKAGCDYNHLFDAEAGYPYDLEWVERDARSCIDSLLERFAPLVRCKYTGEYGEPEQMIPTKWPGEFVLARVRDQVWDSWFEEPAS
jgi:hypothetical protein